MLYIEIPMRLELLALMLIRATSTRRYFPDHQARPKTPSNDRRYTTQYGISPLIDD